MNPWMNLKFGLDFSKISKIQNLLKKNISVKTSFFKQSMNFLISAKSFKTFEISGKR